MHGIDNNHFTHIEVRQPMKLGPASCMLLHERIAGRFGGTFEIFLLKSPMLSICTLGKAWQNHAVSTQKADRNVAHRSLGMQLVRPSSTG